MKMRFEHPALVELAVDHKEITIFDEKLAKYSFTTENAFIMVSGQMIVCPTCGGTGTHDRRDIDCSLLVDGMRAEGDEEGIQNYLDGHFDVVCEQCKGKNVVMEPNWDSVPEWAQKEITEWDECEAQARINDAAERRMGA